jgi:hypothetical protein
MDGRGELSNFVIGELDNSRMGFRFQLSDCEIT